MKLCVDYTELNKKTVPDRHPIPRIKEALVLLGGNSWLSVFDQGKAYHQGFIGKQSQPLPALNATVTVLTDQKEVLQQGYPWSTTA